MGKGKDAAGSQKPGSASRPAPSRPATGQRKGHDGRNEKGE